MNRVVLLDTGIIGLITNSKRSPESLACNCWLQTLRDLRGNNIPARKSLCRRIRPARWHIIKAQVP